MRHLACPTEAFSELKQLSGEAGLTNGYCCLEGCMHARVGIALPFWWWWWWSWFSCSVTSDSATPWTVATRLLCLWGLVMRKHRLRELISYPLSDSSGKVLVFCVVGGGGLWRTWVEKVEGAGSENSRLSTWVQPLTFHPLVSAECSSRPEPRAWQHSPQ